MSDLRSKTPHHEIGTRTCITDGRTMSLRRRRTRFLSLLSACRRAALIYWVILLVHCHLSSPGGRYRTRPPSLASRSLLHDCPCAKEVEMRYDLIKGFCGPPLLPLTSPQRKRQGRCQLNTSRRRLWKKIPIVTQKTGPPISTNTSHQTSKPQHWGRERP